MMLPTASARISVSRNASASSEDLEQELRAQLSTVLADANWAVRLDHVLVSITEDMLECDVMVHGNDSVLAIVEALGNALQEDTDDGCTRGIEDALDRAGVPFDATVSISPEWPLERLCAEVELKHEVRIHGEQM